MEGSNKFIKISQIVICLLLALSIGLNVYLLLKGKDVEVVERVSVEVVRDTLHDTVPEVRYEKLICYRMDTLRLVDTIVGDTVHVVAEIPITQKEYSDDSTYTAWVSGYRQELDSIEVYRKEVYITKEITKTKNNRFVFGPQLGYGYDFNNGRFCPFVGVGLTYTFFGF